MKRVLTFDGPKGGKRFQLLWVALSSGGDGKDRTPAMIRKEARMQDAFEMISEPIAGVAANEPDRRLVNGTDPAPTVTLAQEDFDLLQQYAEKTPWSPRFSRDVVDLWDMLSSSERRD